MFLVGASASGPPTTAHDARAARLLSVARLLRRYLQGNAIASIGSGTLEGLSNLREVYVAEALQSVGGPYDLHSSRHAAAKSGCGVHDQRWRCLHDRVLSAYTVTPMSAPVATHGRLRHPPHAQPLTRPPCLPMFFFYLRAAASWTTTTCGHSPWACSAATQGSGRSA